MHTCHFIERNAKRYPNAPATEENGQQLSWLEFRNRVAALAAGLAEAGAGQGEKIAILADNSVAYIELTYAVQWAGAVVVPLNTRGTPDDIAFALEDCGARHLFVDALNASALGCEPSDLQPGLLVHALGEQAEKSYAESSIETLRAANPSSGAPVTAEDGVASIFYTGGTTGRSKGVQLTHANHVLHSLAFAAELQMKHGTRHLHVAPMFHIADSLFFHVVSALGGTHVVIPRFDPQCCGEALRELAIDQTILVPTMIGMMMNDETGRAGMQALGRLFYGASPMPQSLLDRVMSECPSLDLVQLYGQTESSPVLTVLSGSDHREVGGEVTRSAGRAMLGCELAIFDPEDRPLAAGEHGEIVARGPQITPGYHNRPEENEKTFRSGWLHTGDAGFMDEQGYVYVTDRIKDMIITGGENVYSVEVEQVIYAIAGVDQCCVIGVPHEKWGEAVHAVVVPRADAQLDADTIHTHCNERLARYKRPLSVTVRREPLPVSGAGKLLKRVVRDQLWSVTEDN